MAKTLLRTGLVILVLAGIFFFALRMWESRRGAPTGTSPDVATPEMTLRQVEVTNSMSGATIQISDVSGPGYTIAPVDSPKGLLIDIPNVELGLLQTSIPAPHPLIRNIEANRISAQGRLYARLRVDLTNEAAFRERLDGNTLVIDLIGQAAPTPTPEMIATVAPTPERVVSKPKPKKKIAATRKSSSKKGTTTRKSTPKKKTVVASRPKQKPAPRPVRTPDAEEENADALLRELGIDTSDAGDSGDMDPESPSTAPVPAPAPKVAAPAPAPVQEDGPVPNLDPNAPFGPAPSGAIDDGAPLDLDALFAESQDIPPEPPLVEGAPKVAAIPPKSGKFDSAQVLQDLPGITGLDVTQEGGATRVTINRDQQTKYKVFKMVNPNRIVVDFRDSTNKLKSSYPAFPGTKIEKIQTKQFAGPDGTIARVMIYIDGLPVYEKSTDGSTFILTLP